jgi:uncharacterized OB-fold protein
MGDTLAPLVNDLSRPFWEATADGRLVLPHCRDTGAPFWPPAPTSPFRIAGAVEWREIEAAGILLSLVIYRRAFQNELAAELPYGIALVEVAENVRLLAHVKMPDADDLPGVGTRVGLCFRPLLEAGMAVLTVDQA